MSSSLVSIWSLRAFKGLYGSLRVAESLSVFYDRRGFFSVTGIELASISAALSDSVFEGC